MKAKHAGIPSAVLGSISGVASLLLVVVGLGTGTAVIGRYHSFFIVDGIAVLTWAWAKYFREKGQCACKQWTMSRRGTSLIKFILASVIVVGFAVINIAARTTENPGGTTNLSDTVAARTSVFKVLLPCKAAPQLACGGGLKPILLELERTPTIEQAWVNRNGTALLIIGLENSTSASRAQAVQAVLGSRSRHVEELNGNERNKVLDDFRSGSGWYRGKGVDEVSRQAAKAVAARFVRRTKAKVSLSAANAADLESTVATLLQTAFVDHPERDPPIEDVLKIGRARLDDAAFLAFKEAVESGIYPMPNEE